MENFFKKLYDDFVCCKHGTGVIYIIFLLFTFDCLSTQKVTPRLKLNQLGFYPNAPKLAVITGEVISDQFYITSTNLRDTFLTGRLSEQRQSAYSSAKTRIADFTSFSRKGSYVVLINGVGHSYCVSGC